MSELSSRSVNIGQKIVPGDLVDFHFADKEIGGV